MMVFLDKGQNTCVVLLTFFISNQSDLLWYSPRKYHLYYGACIHCNWINIKFDCWTWYSTECVMCNSLTTLTNLFLLLNVWLTTKSDPPDIRLWLSVQSCQTTNLDLEESTNSRTWGIISLSTSLSLSTPYSLSLSLE